MGDCVSTQPEIQNNLELYQSGAKTHTNLSNRDSVSSITSNLSYTHSNNSKNYSSDVMTSTPIDEYTNDEFESSLQIYDYNIIPSANNSIELSSKNTTNANSVVSDLRVRDGTQLAQVTQNMHEITNKAKVVCFKDVASDKSAESDCEIDDSVCSGSGSGSAARRECKILIESDDIKIVFLSCYDPICWVLSGNNVKSIEKVVICETKHSNLIRECWYSDGSLPRLKGIENLNEKCQITTEMGQTNMLQSRYKSDFKQSYYSQTQTKQKRVKLVKYLENRHNCQISQIIQTRQAPEQIIL